MQVSSSHEIKGRSVVREIGRIQAASSWAGADVAASQEWRERAMQRLIAQAQDFEADAILDVDYAFDAASDGDLSPVALKRVIVSGVAVRLSRG